MFCTFTLVLSALCVQWLIRLFLTSCFPGTLLMYCLSDFEIVPVAPVITSITLSLTFHVGCVSIMRPLHYYYYYYYHHHHHKKNQYEILERIYIIAQSITKFIK
jgi:hypothetical protein